MEVCLPVRALVEFVLRCGSIDSRFSGADRAAEGSRIHRKLQKSAGEHYHAEVAMRAEREVDGITYRLDGRADGIFEEDGGVVIDEIKTTAAPAERLTADFNPLHWAQAKCYAAFYCAENALCAITVQLTYYQIDTEEIVRHRRLFSAQELETFLCSTLHLYTRWALLEENWRELRNASLRALRFPFSAYREGQYRLAGAVYKTISQKGRLLACAPTGIGKTISTLFPALKAMGEGQGSRIFYLTAKTITRQAAQDAIAQLRAADDGALRLKAVTLTAKDKVCFLEERACTPEACPYARGYYDRVNDALYEFLSQNDSFPREAIEAFARKRLLCPFEFALDLTNFCDCIIGDYNYLFDPVVSLKRFFQEGGDYIFLVDEAHNLVHRAREMYSAVLSKTQVYAVKKALGKAHRKLSGALVRLNHALLALRCRAEKAQVHKLVLPQGDEALARECMRFTAAAEDWLEEHREGELHAAVLQLYFDARFFLRIWELYDEHFTTVVSLWKGEVRVELLCLDASPFLDASFALGRASILFSATLTPMEYYRETLGCPEAKRIQLQSPFPAKHFCLLSAQQVSTKYAQREASLSEVCDLIAAAVQARQGNYLVFLPSYQYLEMLTQRFSERYPRLPTAVQQSGMDETARDAYLLQFTAERKETLVGFCVLGGVFSEGIDLAGDRLIGSVIVGVGLPQICAEQDALRDYYESVRGDGFAYAYQYPGMNKVMQAAGRVIRTEQDKGMVLLIDSRYGSYAYRALFPQHWQQAQCVDTPEQIKELLGKFWAQQP